jgi:hypothetical protein
MAITSDADPSLYYLRGTLRGGGFVVESLKRVLWGTALGRNLVGILKR